MLLQCYNPPVTFICTNQLPTVMPNKFMIIIAYLQCYYIQLLCRFSEFRVVWFQQASGLAARIRPQQAKPVSVGSVPPQPLPRQVLVDLVQTPVQVFLILDICFFTC